MKKVITLPGLIDPHVHLRDPGQTHKEDIYTGTFAALAGGFTTVLDMPNNQQPITTRVALEEKISIAKSKTVCDIGFYFGTLGDNLEMFEDIIDLVKGLKIYLNVTTGNFIIDKDKLLEIYKAWPSGKPILLHAEDDVSDLVMSVLSKVPKKTHICHVSSRAELEFVMLAKEKGLPVTCGITPHHLFLNQSDAERLGPFGHMKPYLKKQSDQNFIWDHKDGWDIVESDHAPHTREEKDGPNPPFGVPGLETTLPLMLTAMEGSRITQAELIEKLHLAPARIFNVDTDSETKVEVDMESYIMTNEDLKTKAAWTPFAGKEVIGKVRSVSMRGQKVFADGELLVEPGVGRIL